jgi:hypothetical protein
VEGATVSSDLAASCAAAHLVAATGLARLRHGPVHNVGQDDEVAGAAPNSTNARRARVLASDAVTQDVSGK